MRRHFLVSAIVMVAPLWSLACGGDVVTGSSSTEGSGGAGPTSTSASTSSVGNGGGGGSSTTSASSSSAGVGGAGGAPSEDCKAMDPLVLSDPQAGPDWNPGETVMVTVKLTNTGAKDINYPGIKVTPDQPDVTPASAMNWFFVLFAGQSNGLDVGFAASADVPKGTKVGFTVTAIDIQGTPCANVPTITFEATIE
jgi:hypothetical protein